MICWLNFAHACVPLADDIVDRTNFSDVKPKLSAFHEMEVLLL